VLVFYESAQGPQESAARALGQARERCPRCAGQGGHDRAKVAHREDVVGRGRGLASTATATATAASTAALGRTLDEGVEVRAKAFQPGLGERRRHEAV
jgi:hypothetical protein